MAGSPGERRGRGRRPERTGPGGPGRTARTRGDRVRAAAGGRGAAGERRRPRLTGRAAILVLVLAVLAVSYASSLRSYLQQRGQIDDLQAQIQDRKDDIDQLEQERSRWEDPAYVAQRARELGYVDPGDTPYVVVDENGDPLTESTLGDPDTVGKEPEPRAWYDDLWSSIELAGDPPTKAPPPPEKRIVGKSDQ